MTVNTKKWEDRIREFSDLARKLTAAGYPATVTVGHRDGRKFSIETEDEKLVYYASDLTDDATHYEGLLHFAERVTSRYERERHELRAHLRELGARLGQQPSPYSESARIPADPPALLCYRPHPNINVSRRCCLPIGHEGHHLDHKGGWELSYRIDTTLIPHNAIRITLLIG